MPREFDPYFGVPPLERRQEADTSYTSTLLAAQMAAASGAITNIGATAAAEICAGLWGRAFMSAVVEPETVRTRALTPEVLELIGRSLVRRGEQVFDLVVTRGELELRPAEHWDVYGGPDPRSWEYVLTVSGPTRQVSPRRRSAAVIHARYAPASGRPWRGLSPLAMQSETAGLAAQLESRLNQEAAGPLANLVALPSTAKIDDIQNAIRVSNGRTVLVPTTAGGWESGPDKRPQSDWRPTRLGADPPDALVNLRDRSAQHVVAACGVPTELIERADGTGLREAWRQFLFGTLAPVARRVQAELRVKLEEPNLSLSFDELRASDLAGRARAFQSMVGAGMEPARAANLAGLMEEE